MTAAAVLDPVLYSKDLSFDEIPIVDIGPLLDGSDPDGVAHKIGAICQTVGFFYISNHGVAPSLVDKAYALAKDFFDQPFETKDRLNMRDDTFEALVWLYTNGDFCLQEGNGLSSEETLLFAQVSQREFQQLVKKIQEGL